MKINKFILGLVLALTLTGCSTVKGIFGKNSTKEAKSAAKVELAQSAISQNTDDKLDVISGLSFGTDYALSKETNASQPVIVAKELNSRVENIAGLPPLDQQKQMWLLIDDLISTNQNLVKQGNDVLLNQDKQIIELQSQTKELKDNKDKAIVQYMNLANATAMQSDTLSSELKSYQGFWGLSAIAKGIWSFGSHILWVLIIGGSLFLILRILADTYPPAGIVFGIFSKIGSVIIQAVEYIFPKALQEIELIAKNDYDALKTEYDTLKASIESQATIKPVVTAINSITGSL